MKGKNNERTTGKLQVATRDEELLTAEEVAALLRVTLRTVERWQQEGVLPYLRMGHAIRFHWPTVVSHLLAHFTVCKVAAPRPTMTPAPTRRQP